MNTNLRFTICFKYERTVGVIILVTAIFLIARGKYGKWGYGYSASEILLNTFISDSAMGARELSYRPACHIPILNSKVSVNSESLIQMSDIEYIYPEVSHGGSFRPVDCKPLQRMAIIVPCRDRYFHLLHLLQRLHGMLQHQKRDYTIFVLNQAYDKVFNKGKLMNAGVREILDNQQNYYDCFIFHDVDMLPIDDRNIYSCGDNPRHLSPALDEMRYLLPYFSLSGGVLALNRYQLQKSNGYSNEYWGWGAEDDDIYLRLKAAGFNIERPHPSFGRYNMIKHTKRKRSTERYQKLISWEKRWKEDGQSNIKDIGYRVISREHYKLYTNITIDVGNPPEQHTDSQENDRFLTSSRLLQVFLFSAFSVCLFKSI